MTRLRRLALKISSVVVCRAPENSKEWAQAMAREMEFIPGDWAALRWALGSARMLVQRCETPVRTIADVPHAAARFAKVIRKRTVSGCVICVFETFWFVSFAHRMTNPTQRLGCDLVIGAMLSMAIQLLVRRGTLSERDDSPTSVQAYRLELARQRDFHRGGWFWSRFFLLSAGTLLLCIGGWIAHPRLVGRFAIVGAVVVSSFVAAVVGNFSRALKYQRRIDDLDAAEKNEV